MFSQYNQRNVCDLVSEQLSSRQINTDTDAANLLPLPGLLVIAFTRPKPPLLSATAVAAEIQ
jgi:hypothetical protein